MTNKNWQLTASPSRNLMQAIFCATKWQIVDELIVLSQKSHFLRMLIMQKTERTVAPKKSEPS